MGEFTKALPKASFDRGNQHTGGKTTAVSSSQKPKSEVIRDLGFSQKQVERFETLADNKDLVEQVKAEARENGAAPTRTRVLDLAQALKQKQKAEDRQFDSDYDNLLLFGKAVSFADLYLKFSITRVGC